MQRESPPHVGGDSVQEQSPSTTGINPHVININESVQEQSTPPPETSPHPRQILASVQELHTLTTFESVRDDLLVAAREGLSIRSIWLRSPDLVSPELDLDQALGLKLLHLAAWTGDWETIDDLRSKSLVGASEDAASIHKLKVNFLVGVIARTNSGGFTPLHLAAFKGHSDAVRHLIQGFEEIAPVPQGSLEVFVRLASLDGFTPLHLACFGGYYETVKLLLEKCGDIFSYTKAKDAAFGRTALHFAAEGQRTSKERELDVHRDDSDGGSASQLAPLEHGKVTKLLLETCEHVESYVNAKDSVFGATALHLAACRGQEEIVKVLVHTPHAEPRPRDTEGATPLFWAALRDRKYCNVNVVKELLVKSPGQIHDKVKGGGISRSLTERPQLLVGREEVHFSEEIVDEALNRRWRELKLVNEIKPSSGEHVDEDLYKRFDVPIFGHSVLHMAATQNNAKLVAHLVHYDGIKVNDLADEHELSMTPLHCAIRTGAMESFKQLLLFPQVDLNAQLSRGQREGKAPPWFPSLEKFYLSGYDELDNQKAYEKFWCYQVDDSPLHIAVRCARAEDLVGIVASFCNNASYKHALYNGGTETNRPYTPLELAWLRFSMTGVLRSSSWNSITAWIESLRFWMWFSLVLRPSSWNITLPWTRCKRNVQGVTLTPQSEYDKEEYYLNCVLDMLERHPSNAPVMGIVNDQKKAAQDSLNAIQLTAALIGGVVFTAMLQPPTTTQVNDTVRLFWGFNSLAFALAFYTILICLGRTFRHTMADIHRECGGPVALAHSLDARNALFMMPLVICVYVAFGTFVTSALGNHREALPEVVLPSYGNHREARPKVVFPYFVVNACFISALVFPEMLLLGRSMLFCLRQIWSFRTTLSLTQMYIPLRKMKFGSYQDLSAIRAFCLIIFCIYGLLLLFGAQYWWNPALKKIKGGSPK